MNMMWKKIIYIYIYMMRKRNDVQRERESGRDEPQKMQGSVSMTQSNLGKGQRNIQF